MWAPFADGSHGAAVNNAVKELLTSELGQAYLHASHGPCHLPWYFLSLPHHSPIYSQLVFYEAIKLSKGGQYNTCYARVVNSDKANDTFKTFGH